MADYLFKGSGTFKANGTYSYPTKCTVHLKNGQTLENQQILDADGNNILTRTETMTTNAQIGWNPHLKLKKVLFDKEIKFAPVFKGSWNPTSLGVSHTLKFKIYVKKGTSNLGNFEILHDSNIDTTKKNFIDITNDVKKIVTGNVDLTGYTIIIEFLGFKTLTGLDENIEYEKGIDETTKKCTIGDNNYFEFDITGTYAPPVYENVITCMVAVPSMTDTTLLSYFKGYKLELRLLTSNDSAGDYSMIQLYCDGSNWNALNGWNGAAIGGAFHTQSQGSTFIQAYTDALVNDDNLKIEAWITKDADDTKLSQLTSYKAEITGTLIEKSTITDKSLSGKVGEFSVDKKTKNQTFTFKLTEASREELSATKQINLTVNISNDILTKYSYEKIKFDISVDDSAHEI